MIQVFCDQLNSTDFLSYSPAAAFTGLTAWLQMTALPEPSVAVGFVAALITLAACRTSRCR
jgi:hypothetical protein